MIYLMYTFNFGLMIAMPIMLARYIQTKRRPGWGFFGMGAVTFVLSQVFHIPFNWLIQTRLQLLPTDITVKSNLIIVAVFLGLSAGVFEEVARYLTYRTWATEARTWGKGLMLGAGHGGIEAILLGVLGGINIAALAAMQQGMFLDQIPTDQMPLVQEQITAVFSTPWYLILLGALERAFAICFHLSASLLVMQVFVRGQIRWLVASVLWHTLLNAVAVFSAVDKGIITTEAWLALLSVGSLGIIFWLRTPEPVEPEPEPLPELIQPKPVETTAEMLDRSRYS